MQSGDGAGALAEGLSNQRGFTIVSDDGIVLGACDHGAIAYAMYRAAREEFAGCGVTLRRQGQPLL